MGGCSGQSLHTSYECNVPWPNRLAACRERMLPVPLLLLRLTGSAAVGRKGAAKRQPKFLTNTSPVPGPVANPTADTLVGS